jgi:hypothetical protein
MRKNEEAAVVRLLRKMNEMQRQIQKPTDDDGATDQEILTLIRLFWEYTPNARYPLPLATVLEPLVGWLRGLEYGYCYISCEDVARIIRKASRHKNIISPVILNATAPEMTDLQLYEDGRWNYRETPLVELLFQLCLTSNFDKDGERISR